MIIDLELDSAGDRFDCDIAIVGAGAVGITMAVELASKGADVLLIEAGGERMESASQALYLAAQSVGHRLPGLHEGRYRLLGGTTNFWGGQLVPFDPVVFEKREWLPYSGWPVTRGEVEPYYERVFDVLGLGCLRTDAEVWQRLAVDPPALREGLEFFMTRWLPNPILPQVFARQLRDGALRTLVHANVTQITPAAEHGAQNHLAVRTLGGKTATINARRVVLACGTIEISRLLMLPTGGDKPAPWHASPWLGQGFVDHADCYAGEVIPTDKAAFHALFDNIYLDKCKYHPKIKLGGNAQHEAQLLGISAHFLFLSSMSEHLANLKIFVRSLMGGRKPANLAAVPAHLFALWKVAVPLALRYLRSNRAFNPSDRGIKLRLTAEQFPNRASRISLTNQTDALGLPIVAVDWQLSGEEIETFLEFGNRLKRELERLGLARIELDPRLVARDPAFLATVDDGYHQMGGARMGLTEADGVVDTNLQVHGAHGIYVAGAAVFPSTGFANPTFTAMALGLRLADHLRSAA
ncbi:GMC family oxidoreductase [Novosphingobium sp.]|uniref:FAD-dependent oxidoreductase n=1 Tax=Novosphingobium sp. TaxID=1874826 RepID=UPI002606E133|nr:GMC family oxidoreductase [Novosphingobium sp.]